MGSDPEAWSVSLPKPDIWALPHDATQRRHSGFPLRLIRRFSRPKADPNGLELRRARRLWRTGEHLGPPRYLKIHKPRRDDRRMQLCFQQSARNSALPEINIALRAIRHGLANEDVSNLKAAGRLEHPRHLL